jgi:hypothetical protein
MIDGGLASVERSTVVNFTVSKSVLTNEVWTSDKREEGVSAFCLTLSLDTACHCACP